MNGGGPPLTWNLNHKSKNLTNYIRKHQIDRFALWNQIWRIINDACHHSENDKHHCWWWINWLTVWFYKKLLLTLLIVSFRKFDLTHHQKQNRLVLWKYFGFEKLLINWLIVSFKLKIWFDESQQQNRLVMNHPKQNRLVLQKCNMFFINRTMAIMIQIRKNIIEWGRPPCYLKPKP